jgi:Trk K+ transport system NAD-binding subunit
VIVCGIDGVGLRTVEQLHLAGVPVVAIDPDPQARRSQAVAGWRVPLLTGSPRLPQTLHDAGLRGAQAVLCVQRDDLACLETALLVRELRPDVRVAAQLSNASVGAAMADLGVTVLDIAGLAAPPFVEACLRRRDHPLDIGGTRFVATSTTADRDGTLREIYGSLAPMAVAPSDGGPLVLCPGRDEQVRAGDEVTVLGSDRELADAGIKPSEGPRLPTPRGGTGRGYSTWASSAPPFLRTRRAVRTATSSVLSVADRPVRITLTLLLLLVVAATVVLRLAYDDQGASLTWASSLYFTVETIATVGFGDFSFARQGTGLQVFGIALIAGGTGLVSTTFALLTNALVTRRVEASLGRSHAQAMRRHVVLVGLGAVGVRVMDALLDAGRQVVVVEVDDDNRHLGQARARHVPVVQGDATIAATLEAVQVQHASAVAVLTSDDLVNIETAIAVREALGDRWSRVPVVLRVFDRQLARTIEQAFGFAHVRSTSAIAAPFFVGAALGLDLLGGFQVRGELLVVGRLTVAPGGGLDGLAMGELSARTRVVALDRAGGSLEHPPRRGTRFAAGDSAYLIGPYEELLAVLRRDQQDVAVTDPERSG